MIRQILVVLIIACILALSHGMPVPENQVENVQPIALQNSQVHSAQVHAAQVRIPEPLAPHPIDDTTFQLENFKNTSLCTPCVLVFTLLEDYIKSNQTMEYIIETVSKVCPYLDPSIREVCPLMIRLMAPEVIKAFLERGNPYEVCEMIRLCSKPDERGIPANMDGADFKRIEHLLKAKAMAKRNA